MNKSQLKQLIREEIKKSLKEGFRDPEDNYGFGFDMKYEIDDYIDSKGVEMKPKVIRHLKGDDTLGTIIKVDIENELIHVGWDDGTSGTYKPGEVIYLDSPRKSVDYDEDFTDEDYDKWDAKNLNEGKSIKHLSDVKKAIELLKRIKEELNDPEYTGIGVDAIERIINKSIENIKKLPRLIKVNTRKK